MTQTETNRTAERPPRRPVGSAYWLITNGRRDVLSLYYEGEEMLPVFSYREEAEMFLRLGIVGYGWRASESGARELVSVLYGPCASVSAVALDPLSVTYKQPVNDSWGRGVHSPALLVVSIYRFSQKGRTQNSKAGTASVDFLARIGTWPGGYYPPS